MKGNVMNRHVGALTLSSLLLVAFSAALEARGAAPVGRYTLATDTLTDNVTHLTWQRSSPAQKYASDAANAYCQALTIGGFASGWRLPTIKELQSIVDVSTSSPAIDSTAFPGTIGSYFWSSSTYAAHASFVWFVYFGDGNSIGGDASTSALLRCVR
jgi:hypothetical protein